MGIKIELRLALFVEGGFIAGPRLERGPALPVKQFNFPLSERAQAEEAREQLQNYLDKYDGKKGQ